MSQMLKDVGAILRLTGLVLIFVGFLVPAIAMADPGDCTNDGCTVTTLGTCSGGCTGLATCRCRKDGAVCNCSVPPPQDP